MKTQKSSKLSVLANITFLNTIDYLSYVIGPEVLKRFFFFFFFFMLSSAETKFILLKNVKMPTINIYQQDKLQAWVIFT